MHPQHHRCSLFCIVPPHILEAIASSGDAAEREWALQTMAVDSTFRSARTTAHDAGATQLSAPVAAPRKHRGVYTANHRTALPGTVVPPPRMPAASIDPGFLARMLAPPPPRPPPPRPPPVVAAVRPPPSPPARPLQREPQWAGLGSGLLQRLTRPRPAPPAGMMGLGLGN